MNSVMLSTSTMQSSRAFRDYSMDELVKRVYPNAKRIRASKQGLSFELNHNGKKERVVLITQGTRFFLEQWVLAGIVGTLFYVLRNKVGMLTGSPSVVFLVLCGIVIAAGCALLLYPKNKLHYERNLLNPLKRNRAKNVDKQTCMDGNLRILWAIRYATPFLAKRKTLNVLMWGFYPKDVHIEDLVGDFVLSALDISVDQDLTELLRQNQHDDALKDARETLEAEFKPKWSYGVQIPLWTSALALVFGIIGLPWHLLFRMGLFEKLAG